jgi:hypothetical protein
MNTDELLAFLRSTGWDSDKFVDCLPVLLESLARTQRSSPFRRPRNVDRCVALRSASTTSRMSPCPNR